MSDDKQNRLQDYTNVDAPPVEDLSPSCDRCNGEFSEQSELPRGCGGAEYGTGYVDIHSLDDTSSLCEDCEELEIYLNHRHKCLIERPGVIGSVAVYCQCHADNEVDVRPFGIGESTSDIRCTRCGSGEILLEELPAETQNWGAEQ